MESSNPPLEGIPGQREDATFNLEANQSLAFAQPKAVTEDLDAKASSDQFPMKIVKVHNANNDNDVPAISVNGVEEKDDISLEQLVFSNHLLLEEIFRHSTFEDLKSHRQLNRLWNLEATKTILNRFSMIPIKLSSTGARLSVKCEVICSLEKFQLLVEQSRIFPCNSFGILEAHPSEDTLLRFLRDHGSLIKSLVYELDASEFDDEWDAWDQVEVNGSPTCREFIELLADNLPNLEILDMRTCPSSSQIDPSSPVETAKKLKKLRTLNISCDISEEMLLLVLKRSNNLKSIHALVDCMLPKLVKLNAIHLLNEIRFTFGGDSISLYKQVATSHLQCKEMKVHWCRVLLPWISTLFEADLPNIGRIITDAFHFSSGTLRSLSLECPLGQVPQLRFARCPKVTRIDARYINPAFLPMDLPIQVPPFPSDFNLEVTFPNLRELHLWFECCIDVPLFPDSSVPLLSLRALKCFGTRIPTRWLREFCQLFPNIIIASFGRVLDSDFSLIFTFRVLKKLELSIVVEETDEFVRVDSLLTGFSRETVRSIYRQSTTGFNLNVEDMEKLRVTGSVADLKNLTELVINIICGYIWDESDDDDQGEEIVVGSGLDVQNPVMKLDQNVIISHVSTKFGFDMCPKLQSNVIFKCKGNSFLNPGP